MYAVIVTGGKQYRVQAGDTIFVEKLVAEDGSAGAVQVAGGGGIQQDGPGHVAVFLLGNFMLDGAAVEAKVIKTGKGKKLNIITYRPKKGSMVRKGHRQPYTKVEITAIKG